MIALAALLLAPGSATPGWRPPFDEARVPALLSEKCSREWPDDYSMQETCLRMQKKGAIELKQIDERYGDKFNKQVERCVEEWTKEGTPDFTMIATCSRMQIESYFRLNAPPKP